MDKATAGPAVHKRITGECMPDVIGGSGFLAEAANRLGLRGYVLDTEFGPRYDVTKSLVRTRTRQDVSAGKCVAGMISPPRWSCACVDRRAESGRYFWLETWTTEICTVLLANVLGQVDVAVFQDKTSSSKSLTITLRC